MKNDKTTILSGLDYVSPADTKKLSCPNFKGLGIVSPNEIYNLVTEKILSLLQSGDSLPPWQKPWQIKESTGLSATNYVSKKAYRGINSMMLNLIYPLFYKKEFKSPYFLTFKQITDLKGKLKKGSKGYEVFYYTFIQKSDGKKVTEAEFNKLFIECAKGPVIKNGKNICEQLSSYAVIKYYHVFSADDVEGIEFKMPAVKKITGDTEKIDVCERIVSNYPYPKPEIVFKDPEQAYYSPSNDIVNMPPQNSFKDAQAYYSTMYHELVHSTGSPTRNKRKMGGKFGSKEYAFEELIAELGASYLNAESGILYFNIKNSAAYLKNWSKSLIDNMKADNKFFLNASSAAQKANDFILQHDEQGIPLYIKKSPTTKAAKDEQMKIQFTGAKKNDAAAHFIQTYINLHKKKVTPDKVLSILKSLQVAIKEKTIRKSHKLAKHIIHIQDQLVKLYNSMEGAAIVEISNVEKYQGLGFLPVVAAVVAGKAVDRAIDHFFPKKKPINGLAGAKENTAIEPIYSQFKGKPKEAIKHLIRVKKGDCQSALYREGIGFIDIIWGENDPKTNKGFGLKHIIEKHGKEIEQLGFKVEDFIPLVVQTGIFEKSKRLNRILLIGKMFRIVIAQEIYGKKKMFVLTAFDLTKKGFSGIDQRIDGVDFLTKPLPSSPDNPCTKIQKSSQNTNPEGFTRADQRTKVVSPNVFKLSGEMGKFIQDIQPYKYSIIVTGDPHAGKTEFVTQLINAFAEAKKKVGLFSIEQGGLESKDTREAIDRNISPKNQQLVQVTGTAKNGIATLKQFADQFDVVVVDSWQKLGIPSTQFDTLRHEHPNTIWVIIFQQNGEGGTRGGVSADYDTPVLVKVHKVDTTFKNNYVEMKKNRGNSLNVKYIVSKKKTVPAIVVEKKEVKKAII